MVRITLRMWRDFEDTRLGGTMNMWGHWMADIFCNDEVYSASFKHFEEDGRTDVLVIE